MSYIESSSVRPSRRGMLIGAAGVLGGGLKLASGSACGAERVVKNGRLKQSVCKWCYQMPVEELAAVVKQMGLVGIDLLTPRDFPAFTLTNPDSGESGSR